MPDVIPALEAVDSHSFSGRGARSFAHLQTAWEHVCGMEHHRIRRCKISVDAYCIECD